MPFKDSKEGSTHYQNDGCGEIMHNDMQEQEWKETFCDLYEGIDGDSGSKCMEYLVPFVESLLAAQRAELVEKVKGMKHNLEDHRFENDRAALDYGNIEDTADYFLDKGFNSALELVYLNLLIPTEEIAPLPDTKEENC